jgi:hypothetical protein
MVLAGQAAKEQALRQRIRDTLSQDNDDEMEDHQPGVGHTNVPRTQVLPQWQAAQTRQMMRPIYKRRQQQLKTFAL